MTKLLKPLILSLLLLASFHAGAQYFKPNWVNDIGGTVDSKATNIAADNNGNIYVSGYIRGTITFDLRNGGTKQLTAAPGAADIYLAKYDQTTGNYEWAISMKGSALAQPNSMTVDPQGNVLIMGQYQASVNFNPAGNYTLTSNGEEDVFVAKYDPAGNFLWAISMGSTDIDRGQYIATDSQGNVFITATYTGTVDVDPSAGTFTLPTQSSLTGFFAKYDANGNFVWAHPLGVLPGPASLVNLTVDKATNDVIVDGDFAGTFDFSYTGNPAATFGNIGVSNFLARYTNNGTYEWVKNLTGSGNASVSSVKTDNLGNIVIVGEFGGSFKPGGPAGTPLTANGVNDLMVASYKADGTLNWAKNFGSGNSNVNTRYVATDASNNIFITGYFSGTVNISPSLSDGILTNNGGYSIMIVGLNSSGTPIAAGAIGSCSADLGYEIAASNGNIFVAGAICGTADFDTGSCNTDNVTAINGTSDSFLASFSIATGGPIANNVITAPTPALLCAPGDPGTITATTPTGGGGTFTYQWQSSTDGANFTDIPGATALTYDAPAINLTTYYRRIVSSTCGAPLISNVISIQIQAALNNNTLTAPPVIAFCSTGNPANIFGSPATGGDGVNYNYQWQSSTDGTNFTNISGATSSGYDPPVVNATTYYRRIVTSGACTTPLISNVITITIDPPLANNTISFSNNTTFCGAFNGVQGAGPPFQFAGTTPTGGNGTYSYQWQNSADGVNFTDMPGATVADLLLPATNANTWFRRTVTSGSCAATLISNVIEIVIQPVLVNNTITAPAVASFCGPGDPAAITSGIPTGGSGVYNYQWQSSADNTTFTDIPGATSAGYDPPLLNATTYYRRAVTSGSCTTPQVSASVEIIINTIPPTPVPTAATVSICTGSTITLSVAPPQPGITYDWYDSPSKTNHLFTGVNYTTAPLNSNQTYYIQASSGAGCSNTTLASVQVNVSTPPSLPVVTGVTSVCNGTSATLNIQNPQAGFTYNWYSAQSGGTALYTGATFVTPALSSNITYYVDATNAGGCTSINRTSINLIVSQLPTVSAEGAAICPGTKATLLAITTDNNANINWYTAASGGSSIFTGAFFTTPALNANTTYYAEAADNVTGCISANRIAIQVQMIQPLAAPTVTVASTTTSSVTFQWTAVSGATGYQVSTNNGQTFTDPSSGSDGLTHTVSGLQAQQSATIVVRAVGSSACAQSANSAAVTGLASSPLGDEVFVPNAFTPNGDGKNDIVYVRGVNIRSMKFYVYDQWGEMIYSTTNLTGGWDGTYKGSKEPAGVYVYYVEAIMNDGTGVNKKGSITLLR